MVNSVISPSQVGEFPLTSIVTVIGSFVVFIAVKSGIFPLPEAAGIPIAAQSPSFTFHSKVTPEIVALKSSMLAFVLWQYE